MKEITDPDFKGHILTKEHPYQFLFQEPETNVYYSRIIFLKHRIVVVGDIGDWVWSIYAQTEDEGISWIRGVTKYDYRTITLSNLNYFTEKISSREEEYDDKSTFEHLKECTIEACFEETIGLLEIKDFNIDKLDEYKELMINEIDDPSTWLAEYEQYTEAKEIFERYDGDMDDPHRAQDLIDELNQTAFMGGLDYEDIITNYSTRIITVWRMLKAFIIKLDSN